MGLTKHQKVLSVLEKRALRYRGRGGLQSSITTDVNSIDETGTVDTRELTDSDSDGDLLSDGDSINNNKNLTAEQKELKEIQEVLQGMPDDSY